MLQISRQSIKAVPVLAISKCGAKNYVQRNKTNFEGSISQEQLGGFGSNLELEVPHPEGICTENFVWEC